MTEDPRILEESISILNDAFADKTIATGRSIRPFELRSDGDDQVIFFLGIPVWSSVEDERNSNRNGFTESVHKFIRRESNRILKTIKLVKRI